ncbi:MAG: site-2 protease family protein [candidate division NC10 bacterium]
MKTRRIVLFNLIPAFPLDGGRILRAALWRAWGDSPRATRAAAGAGRFFAYFLMVGGISAHEGVRSS